MTRDKAFTPGTVGRNRKRSMRAALIGATALITTMPAVPTFAQAPQQQKPNILLIVSDDTGCLTSAPVGQIEGLHERRMAGSS